MRAGRLLITTSLSLGMAFAGLAVADTAHAASATRYVALTGDDGARVPNDCTVQANPCATIQHAIDVADAGDTVQLGAGTFAQFASTSQDLTLRGAAGGGTVVDGASGLDGASFTVRGGGDDDRPTVTIRDITLSGDGTGLLVQNADVRVRGSHLDANKAAGLYATDATITLTGSTASRNVGTGSVPGLGFPAGDGVIASGGTLTLDGSSVDDNSTAGVLALGTAVTVTDSSVSRNAVKNPQFLPFGIIAFSAPLRVSGSTVQDNGVGGIIAEGNIGLLRGAAPAPTDTAVAISDTTVSGNKQVGVVAEGGATLDLDTSTVSGNGIGVYAFRTAATVRNSTVANTVKYDFDGNGPTSAGLFYEDGSDDAARSASAVASFAPALTTMRFGKAPLAVRSQAQRRAAPALGFTVSGTVLDQSGSVPDCTGTAIVDAGYNLSADRTNSCRFTAAKKSITKTAAKLGALKDNGGATATQLPAATSPLLGVIPAGKAGCVAGATDQRGLARRQGARCDIGAVERALEPVRITTKSVPHGQAGERYRTALAATGGDGEYLWALAPGSRLPAGLSLSTSGVITGTPTKAGRYEFAVLADSAASGFTLVVDAAGTGDNGSGPNDNGADPIAETGAPSASLITWGSALVLLGLVTLLVAAQIGRRPGRHRRTA